MKKKFWRISARIIECDKPEGTVSEGPQGLLNITVKVTRSFLQHLSGCWKQKKIKRKAFFPLRKIVWPIFSRIIKCDKPQGTVFKGPQGDVTVAMEGKRSCL